MTTILHHSCILHTSYPNMHACMHAYIHTYPLIEKNLRKLAGIHRCIQIYLWPLCACIHAPSKSMDEPMQQHVNTRFLRLQLYICGWSTDHAGQRKVNFLGLPQRWIILGSAIETLDSPSQFLHRQALPTIVRNKEGIIRSKQSRVSHLRMSFMSPKHNHYCRCWPRGHWRKDH